MDPRTRALAGDQCKRSMGLGGRAGDLNVNEAPETVTAGALCGCRSLQYVQKLLLFLSFSTIEGVLAQKLSFLL
jgi:hypothetical protein